MRRIDGWSVAVVVICLLTGLLFGVSHNSADGYDLRGGRTAELSGLVRAAEAGTGLIVTLTDAPRGPDGRYPEGVEPDALVVHQQDVHSVVNGLWAGGADAIAVQDQRLINTSAVRCIGNTLLLGGRTCSPPFVITAIGDPIRLSAGLDDADGVRLYQQYAQAYGLGYEVQAPRTVSVPAYAGSLRLVSAQEEMR